MYPSETGNNSSPKERAKETLENLLFVLENMSPQKDSVYHDTPLDFRQKESEIPEKIRQMRLLYTRDFLGNSNHFYKAKNFYVQGKFMENYEDDFPWYGEIRTYLPDYKSLSIEQLRGYFTWRGKIRKGVYEKNAEAFAFIYIFELLNGIGVSSTEEMFEKLLEFKEKYAGEICHHFVMQDFIRQWIFEFAVVKGMSRETILRYADPEDLKWDHTMLVLKEPEKYESREIFEAMCDVAGKKYWSSSVIKKLGNEGMDYFAGVWKFADTQLQPKEKTLFDKCFGTLKMRMWYPLNMTLCYFENPEKSITYDLDECRSFNYAPENDIWFETSYRKMLSGVEKFSEFMRSADRLLRVYLKTGRQLQEKREEKWADRFINAFIEADKAAKEEAKKVKISIDFSGLEKIRKDAVTTCDSLLTEEEKLETADEIPVEKAESLHDKTDPKQQNQPGIQLDKTLLGILTALLHGESAAGIIAANHGMPEIYADTINEAFFDEIGDNIVECDGKELVLVEDYRDDVMKIIVGKRG